MWIERHFAAARGGTRDTVGGFLNLGSYGDRDGTVLDTVTVDPSD
jgi:hypothetical protein